MRQFSFSFSCIILFLALSFCCAQTVCAYTEITGQVTEKRGESVKVIYQVNTNATPQKSDRVDFKKIINGYKVKAGYGEVIESGASFVWVKIIKKPARLKMTATILATDYVVANSTEQNDTVSKPDQLPRRPEKNFSQDDLQNAIIHELIRLHYVSPDQWTKLSVAALQAVIDMCGIEHGFPSGRKINLELLTLFKTLNPQW